jgi:hypothetical protein
LNPCEENEIASEPPVPLWTFPITKLSDRQIEEMQALLPMRLAAVPEDDPSKEPVSTTNAEPEARGNAASVEFETTGDMYDNILVRMAERVSTEMATLGVDAKPSAHFKRKADEAFHSVIRAAVPPVEVLGDDSSDDRCLPNTVENTDPVAGR